MPIELALLLKVPFAVLAGSLSILVAEWASGHLAPAEQRASQALRWTGMMVSLLVVGGMALLWASWAGRFNEAPLAMWGTLLAAGGLVLLTLRPTTLRAAIGIVLALIPPAFFWFFLAIASECARTGCSWLEKFSVVPVTVLVALAVLLFLVDLGRAARNLLARNGSARPTVDPGGAAS